MNKGEHGDPHELPQEQYSEGSTEIEHTLHSHTANNHSKIDSLKKLEYIYQHLQYSEKIYQIQTQIQLCKCPTTPYIHTLMVLNMAY